jgi:signal transduction histidine kinase
MLSSDESGFVLGNHLFFLRKDGVFFEGIDKNGSFRINQIANYSDELKYYSKNTFSQIKVFQSHPKEPAYLLASNQLFKVDLVNDKIQLNLISNQVPINEFIKYVQIDNLTNTIYLGTDNRGLIVGRPKYFNRILPNNAVDGVSSSAYAQVLLKNGDIQINTGQLYKGNSKTNTSSNLNIFTRPSETTTFISEDSFLYFTNFEGVIKYDLVKNKVIEKSNDISPTRNAFIEFKNKLYSFNVDGVAVKNEKWEYVLKFSKMPFNFIVYGLIQVNNHEILAATTNGLYKYNVKLNTFNLFYKEKSNANFRAIFNLGEYYLLGTYGGGIYMYRNDTIKKLPLDQNGYLNYTHCFIKDNKGRIWASTNKGLFMSPSKSLIDFWNLGPGNIKFSYFGKPEGIDELEMNGGCSPCAIKLADGRFSFPGIDGLIQFHPDSLPEVSIQPKVYLDKLILDGKVFKVELLNKELNASIKNIELQLGISGMLSQENIMLEYKYDEEPWVRVNVKSPNLKFSNPGYGAHKVTIRIRNTINDKWETITYGFSINYPWYLNPYVFIIYFFMSIGMVLLYIRFKTIIYQRRQKILEKEVDAKTQTLNKLNENLLKRNQAKDHVIAIMNHDILTPLKYLHITAKNIAETSNEEKIKKSINQIAKTSKDLEYLTSNMLNWVKFDNVEALPKKQDLDLFDLVNELVEFVEPFKQNNNVLIKNEVTAGLVIQNWADSLRVLLYNIIINAIHSTNEGSINISYKVLENGYKIIINDTGVGMNESMIQDLIKGKSKDEVL